MCWKCQLIHRFQYQHTQTPEHNHFIEIYIDHRKACDAIWNGTLSCNSRNYKYTHKNNLILNTMHDWSISKSIHINHHKQSSLCLLSLRDVNNIYKTLNWNTIWFIYIYICAYVCKCGQEHYSEREHIFPQKSFSMTNIFANMDNIQYTYTLYHWLTLNQTHTQRKSYRFLNETKYTQTFL